MIKEKLKEYRNLKYKIWVNIVVMIICLNSRNYRIIKVVFAIVLKVILLFDIFKICKKYIKRI